MRSDRSCVLLLLRLAWPAYGRRLAGHERLNQDGDGAILHADKDAESTEDYPYNRIPSKSFSEPKFDKTSASWITRMIEIFIHDWSPPTQSVPHDHVPGIGRKLQRHWSFTQELLLQALRCAEDSHNLKGSSHYSKRYQPRTPSNDKDANPYYKKRFVNAYKWKGASQWQWLGFLTKFIEHDSSSWKEHGIAVLALHGTRSMSDYWADVKIAMSRKALDRFANEILCQAGTDLLNLQEELNPGGITVVEGNNITKPLRLMIIGHSLGGILATKIADLIARKMYPSDCKHMLPPVEFRKISRAGHLGGSVLKHVRQNATDATSDLNSMDKGNLHVKVITLGSPISIPKSRILPMASNGMFLAFRANSPKSKKSPREEANAPIGANGSKTEGVAHDEVSEYEKYEHQNRQMSYTYLYDQIPWEDKQKRGWDMQYDKIPKYEEAQHDIASEDMIPEFGLGNLRKCSTVGEKCVQLHWDTCEDAKSFLSCHSLQTFYNPAIREALFQNPHIKPDDEYYK